MRGVVRATPAEHSANLSQRCERPVILKPEHFQRTGSYKIRGAYNHICRLPAGTTVVAASAGNHAQGVALAATLCGLAARIYMPASAALPKVVATRDYGAEVVLGGETVDDCMALARAAERNEGFHFVPPFDDPLVIAGQGTVGLELVEEAPDAGVVVVPVGGGGLIAGVATAFAALRPGVRVVGVEAEGAPTMTRALAAGRPVQLEAISTMADGTALRAVSALTLAHAVAQVHEVVTVTEEEISQAVLLLLERAKWVVEPSGALGLAALMAGRVSGTEPAAAICTGGNVDPLLMIKLIEHGLSAAGRYLLLRMVIGDRPGALADLLATVAAQSANVLEVSHHRAGVLHGVAEVEVLLTLETRSADHRQAVVDALWAAGHHPEPLA